MRAMVLRAYFLFAVRLAMPHVIPDATRLLAPDATISTESRPWYLWVFMLFRLMNI
jgi:hypothetical protein